MSEKPVPIKVDSRGRITIPQRTREKYGIGEEDTLFLVKSEPGVLVFYTLGKLVENVKKNKISIKES